MKWNDVNKKELTDFSGHYLFSKGEGDWIEGLLSETKTNGSGKFMTIIAGDDSLPGFKFWASVDAPKKD